MHGDKTVALIDNVRDANYYDFPANTTYIAGFHSSQYNELFDRNVMTIDAYDWAHRTGANPPDEPTSDVCTSRPARPFLYESTFAHEWQHLLHYYSDPFEEIWLNEGMSDFAQTLTGYVDASKTVFERGADSHIYCFQGFGSVQTPFNPNPRDCGGPENSLNLWNEGTPAQVLADYGNAYSLMLYLYDHYGTDLMSRLHRDGDLQGLPSVDAALTAEGQPDLYRLIHDFQTSTLVDKIVEGNKGKFQGRPKALVTTPSLRSTVNFADPNVNDNPGAAPNGADYVLLKGSGGNLISGKKLRSLSFEGAPTLPPTPLLWTVVNNDPDRPGNPVLWSGNANNLDAGAVTSVAVPTTDPTLRFLAKYGAEEGFDYGYVIVSTDGGADVHARSRVTRPSTGRWVLPSTARPRGSRRTPTTCRPTRARTCCSASATSPTAASTRAAGSSTTSRSAPRRSATAAAWRRSTRHRRSTRSTCTGTCGWSASTRARRRPGSSSTTARAP